MSDEFVVPAEEAEDNLNLVDPDVVDDELVENDDQHPDNDDEEPSDDVSE